MQLVASLEYQAAAEANGHRADRPYLNLNFGALTSAPVAVPLALRSRNEDEEYAMPVHIRQMPGLQHLRLIGYDELPGLVGDKQLLGSLRAVLAMPPGQTDAEALLREWIRVTAPMDVMAHKDDLARVLRGVC